MAPEINLEINGSLKMSVRDVFEEEKVEWRKAVQEAFQAKQNSEVAIHIFVWTADRNRHGGRGLLQQGERSGPHWEA